MNPLWRCTYSEEAPRFEQQAAARYAHLLALSPARRQREELAAGGVAQSAIEALYPADLADVLESIKPLLTAQHIAHITNLEQLRSGMDQMGVLLQDMDGQQASHLTECVRQNRVTRLALVEHIAAHLPKSTYRDLSASSLTMLLLHAWSFMRYTGEVSPQRRAKVQEYFVTVTDLLLPSL